MLTIFLFQIGCNGSKLIHDQKVGSWTLGDNWPPVKRDTWRGKPIVDTTFYEGGFTWRGLLLNDKKGTILLEEDFLEEQFLNRIRVQSKRYQTQSGISVGQTWGEIKSQSKEWQYIWLESYGLMDVSNPASPNIHLLIKPQLGVVIPENGDNWSQVLADEAYLESIVVM